MTVILTGGIGTDTGLGRAQGVQGGPLKKVESRSDCAIGMNETILGSRSCRSDSWPEEQGFPEGMKTEC